MAGFRRRAPCRGGIDTLARVAMVALALTGCAPSTKTVALVSVGNTGCPAEDLAVFSYKREGRSWRAACGDKLYVCSDIRGATECNPQQPHTEEPELRERVRLLLTLPKDRRDRFIDVDVLAIPWEDYSTQVQVAAKLSSEQLEEIDDLTSVFAGFSADFNDRLRACTGQNRVYQLRATSTGFVSRSSDRCANAGLLKHPDIQHLAGGGDRNYYLVADIFEVRPLPRPATPVASTSPGPAAPAAPAPAAPAAPNTPPEPDGTKPNIESEVRAWLDGHAAEVLECVGSERVAVLVRVSDGGAATVTLRGDLAGGPEQGCVVAALGSKQLEAGPLEIVHLVKREDTASAPD